MSDHREELAPSEAAPTPTRTGPSSAFTSADPPRNFTLSVGDRVRAMTIGVPAYAARKKSLEDLEDRYVNALVDLHDGLVAKYGSDPELEVPILRALADKAATFNLERMNTLVANHNRYYPIEANLACNLRGEFLVYGRRWLPEEPWTMERLVERALGVAAARERERREVEEG